MHHHQKINQHMMRHLPTMIALQLHHRLMTRKLMAEEIQTRTLEALCTMNSIANKFKLIEQTKEFIKGRTGYRTQIAFQRRLSSKIIF